MSERWKPKKGEMFWYFDCAGIVFPATHHGYLSDLKVMAFGNMFKTEEEAKSAAEKIKKFLLNEYDLNADFEPIHKVLEYLGDKLNKSVENIPPTMPYDQYNLITTINFMKNKKSELAVFPEWCKVGEWVYSPCCCDPDKGTYFKVTQIDGVCIIGENNVCHVDNAVRARLRPYNSEEMKALVGKVICWNSRDKLYVVESYGEVYGQGNVFFGGLEYSAKDLLVAQCILSDGKQCGVLEHLNENGEWVE